MAVLFVAALGACGTSNQLVLATASPTALVAASQSIGSTPTDSVTPTPSIAPTETPAPAIEPSPTSTPEASPSETPADADDEAPGDETTGGGATPDPNESAAPAPDAGIADRLPGEPDPALTPGALNPDVTQATIHATICVSGWTATIRPSSSYTTKLKIEQIGLYGYSDTRTSSYEEDHLIPLQLGGAPADAHNLWPQPYTASLPDGRPTGARTKDVLETKLKRQVCDGTMTLAEAQRQVGVHWVHFYYGLPVAPSPTPTAPLVTPAPTRAPAPTRTPAPTAATTAFRVTFVAVPHPAQPRHNTSLSAKTSPGARCSLKVVWPSGRTSDADGTKTTPTAGSNGVVSWTWYVQWNTKAGTGHATVTCTRSGKTATGSVAFPVG